VELKIFETIVQDGGRPKTATELAAPTGASEALVKRVARTVASAGMLDEKAPGIYVPNSLTALLAQPEYAAGIIFCFDCTQPSFAQLPRYLRETKFQNPENTINGPFQYAHNFDGHAFGWLMQHPKVFQAFHSYANMLWQHRPSWLDMYPVHEHLVQGLKDGTASALVDVGGGTGQIVKDFQQRIPEYRGALILQERSEVIAAAKETGLGKGEFSRIQLQTHDFFEPQPIKGARAYFMRYILHDWPDEQCRIILGRLKDALEPGYSKILINDCVLADQEAAWQHVSLDLFMMAQTSAQERTESEWRQLIETCGLKVAGIYNKGSGNEGLIEVVLE
jgi:SAM-dependent methyltransferase